MLDEIVHGGVRGPSECWTAGEGFHLGGFIAGPTAAIQDRSGKHQRNKGISSTHCTVEYGSCRIDLSTIDRYTGNIRARSVRFTPGKARTSRHPPSRLATSRPSSAPTPANGSRSPSKTVTHSSSIRTEAAESAAPEKTAAENKPWHSGGDGHACDRRWNP